MSLGSASWNISMLDTTIEMYFEWQVNVKMPLGDNDNFMMLFFMWWTFAAATNRHQWQKQWYTIPSLLLLKQWLTDTQKGVHPCIFDTTKYYITFVTINYLCVYKYVFFMHLHLMSFMQHFCKKIPTPF